MTYQAALTALVELILMLAVIGAYIVLAQRHRRLWHPVSIVLAVGIVGIVVSLMGELFRGGWAGVPTMLGRSATGSFGWGVIIAVMVWLARRLFVPREKSER